MVEKIAQFLTDLTGSHVDEPAVFVALFIVAGSVVFGLLVSVWFRIGQLDQEAVEAEWEHWNK